MEIIKKHNILGGVVILLILVGFVACGGGGGVATQTTTTAPALTGKNAGGITYTTEDLVGIDANADGVEDRVAKTLSDAYSSQPAVLNAFMQSAKLDRALLSIPNEQLPKTEAEAKLLVDSDESEVVGCLEYKALGDNDFEKESLRYYFINFNTPAKRQRLKEIEKLAGFSTRPVRTCDEILNSTATAVK